MGFENIANSTTSSSKIPAITEIFPEEFFNISQPDTPIVQIQVRTKINPNSRIDNNDDWTEVHLEPGMTNYFNSMTVEDAGGLQRVVMSFFDKNFANVENAIIRSLVATKEANVLATTTSVQDDTGFFEFKIDNQVMTNIRIRFGYSEVTQGSQNFIDDTAFNGSEYSNRVNSNKTIIRSPWIYLQMIGTKFDLRDEGLFAEITAFSVMDSFLSKAKLVRRFAILKGTPEEILISLGNIIEEAAGGTEYFKLNLLNPPIEPTTEGANGEIEINLGSEANDITKSWRTMNSVLSEIMSKIPPRNYDKNDKWINSEDEDADIEKVSKSIPYKYFVRQEVLGGKLKTFLEFKYPDPITQTQDKIRTYIWKEYGQSIVKNLNISSQVDFASLNAQVLTVSGDNVSLHVARPSSSNVNPDSKSSTHLGSIANVTKALNKDDYSFTFISNTIGVDGGEQSTIGARIAANIVRNLNDGVFKGTIEIPGDPFYLFDNKLSPYQYLIKIIVQRPGYIDSDNKYQGTSVSYLSGYYGVSKITHTINASGFSTTLEVVRWPIEG